MPTVAQNIVKPKNTRHTPMSKGATRVVTGSKKYATETPTLIKLKSNANFDESARRRRDLP
jgi:hypothetical protein